MEGRPSGNEQVWQARTGWRQRLTACMGGYLTNVMSDGFEFDLLVGSYPPLLRFQRDFQTS